MTTTTTTTTPKYIWFFDSNHRVYPPDRKGPPIWREHWRKVEVERETRQSYILTRSVWLGGRNTKRAPKSMSDPYAWYFALDEATINLREMREYMRHNASLILQGMTDDDLSLVASKSPFMAKWTPTKSKK